MGEAVERRADGNGLIDFRTEPTRYRHWRLGVDGNLATLTMDVDEKAGLLGGYELKLNSYDLGVDIELALACDHIMLVDDGSASVSLPELPLLAVLPGTGGLTRVTDKRKVRRDHADVFCTTEEGVKGKRAVEWRLVDEVAPRSKLEDAVGARVKALASQSQRPAGLTGIKLTPLQRDIAGDRIRYSTVDVDIEREQRIVTVTIRGPDQAPPKDTDALVNLGADYWPLRCARELDDAILHLRLNELATAVIVFKTLGDPRAVIAQ